MGHLVLEDSQRKWDLRGHAVSIGRYPHNQVQLSDPSVSREHALLFVVNDALYVKDLGSMAGTFLDGVPVEPEQPVPVHESARLGFGTVELRLRRV